MTEQKDETSCIGCEQEIDPELCWCGDLIGDHIVQDGHSPVPMGCVCGFPDEKEKLVRYNEYAEQPNTQSEYCCPACGNVTNQIEHHTGFFLPILKLKCERCGHEWEDWPQYMKEKDA